MPNESEKKNGASTVEANRQKGQDMYKDLDLSSRPNCSLDAFDGRPSLVKEMRGIIEEVVSDEHVDVGKKAFVDALQELSEESRKKLWGGLKPAEATRVVVCRGLGIDPKTVTDGHWQLVKDWNMEMAYCWQARKSKTGEWHSEYVGVAGQGPRSTFYKRTFDHICNAFNPKHPEFFSFLSTRLRKVGMDRWRVLILPSSRTDQGLALLPRNEEEWMNVLGTARTRDHRIGLNAVGGEKRQLPIIDENEKGRKVEVRWFLGGKHAAFVVDCIRGELLDGVERVQRRMSQLVEGLSSFSPPRTAEYHPRKTTSPQKTVDDPVSETEKESGSKKKNEGSSRRCSKKADEKEEDPSCGEASKRKSSTRKAAEMEESETVLLETETKKTRKKASKKLVDDSEKEPTVKVEGLQKKGRASTKKTVEKEECISEKAENKNGEEETVLKSKRKSATGTGKARKKQTEKDESPEPVVNAECSAELKDFDEKPSKRKSAPKIDSKVEEDSSVKSRKSVPKKAETEEEQKQVKRKPRKTAAGASDKDASDKALSPQPVSDRESLTDNSSSQSDEKKESSSRKKTVKQEPEETSEKKKRGRPRKSVPV